MYLHLVAAAALFATTATAQEGPLKVTNGTQVPQGQWSDAVGVIFGGRQVGCTGTLIAPNVVLTAGHCIEDRVTHVIIGSTDYTSSQGELIEVERAAAHPEYRSGRGNGPDLAVLMLAEDSIYEPRALAEGCVVDDYLYDGAPVAVVGYGATDSWGRVYGSELIEGYTEVTDADCSAVSRGCQRAISPGGEIGAGGVNNDGVDACYGDSGGPLYLLTEIGDYLVGVTSRAFWDVPVPCGLGGIWVRPDAFGDWIRDETGATIPEATCNAPPVVSGGSFTVAHGKSHRDSVQGSDPEGSELSVALLESPKHGTVEVDVNGSYVYTASDDYLGSDSFWVTVSDSAGHPLQSVDVVFNVSVVEKKRFLGCSCSSASIGGAGGYGLVALLGLGLVRRRR